MFEAARRLDIIALSADAELEEMPRRRGDDRGALGGRALVERIGRAPRAPVFQVVLDRAFGPRDAVSIY